MSCTNRLPAKGPDEKVTITFDFSADLLTGETIGSINSVVISVRSGVDPSPSAVLAGVAQVATSGLQVLQSVQAGIDSTDYDIRALVTTSAGRIIGLSAVLPVRAG